jgi:hypothetical protein
VVAGREERQAVEEKKGLTGRDAWRGCRVRAVRDLAYRDSGPQVLAGATGVIQEVQFGLECVVLWDDGRTLSTTLRSVAPLENELARVGANKPPRDVTSAPLAGGARVGPAFSEQEINERAELLLGGKKLVALAKRLEDNVLEDADWEFMRDLGAALVEFFS